MEFSKETVKQVANLARIELQDKELEQLSVQVKDIISFIDKLNELDVKNIPPTSHVLPVSNVLRVDEPSVSLPVTQVLANAPEKEGNFFVVPKVIE